MGKKYVQRNRFWTGFAAGLAAGAAASGVMLFLSVSFGGVSLPEAVGAALTSLMPPPVFDYLHRNIGGDAKHYFFYGILIGQCLIFALSGALYHRRVNPLGQPLRWGQGLVLALILWLFAGVILLPLTGVGVFGANLNAGFGTGFLSLGVVGLVFGLLFVLTQRWLVTRTHLPDQDTAGSAVLRFITAGSGTSKAAVGQLLKQYKRKIVPPPTPNYGQLHPTPFLSPEVTSNDQFYVVSKNLFADPTVESSSWRLTVDGQVDSPSTLTYRELLALPMQQQYESLMCVSNEVGGQYMSNALWEGVPLVALLQRAGLRAGATKVVFHAADDYTDSIHLSKALEPTTLLAVRMNGVPLPQEHGFPARMLVPGIYGMKHCKWVTRIEVVTYDYQGYWQQRGWSDPAPVRMTARIDTPLDGSTVAANRTTFIAGVAFSGEQGISEVDVSTDGGQTWQRATLKQPLSDLTWVLWELAWQPKAGNAVLVVRAIDLKGNVQNPVVEPPLPDGSSGYHTINVIVA